MLLAHIALLFFAWKSSSGGHFDVQRNGVLQEVKLAVVQGT